MNRNDIRAAILAARDIQIDPVATPEWPEVNGYVYVRTMTAAMRETYITSIRDKSIITKETKVIFDYSSTKLAAATMCDEHGELLFTFEDVQALSEKSYSAMERVRDASADINGFSDKAKRDAKNESAQVPTSALSTV